MRIIVKLQKNMDLCIERRNEVNMAEKKGQEGIFEKEFWDGEPTDQELEEMGIEIPETETDQSFFDWINKMIQEIFQEEN